MDLAIYAVFIPLTALALDLILGEPPLILHPVVWMGRLIGFLDGKIERGRSWREKALGVLLGIFPIVLFVALFTILLALLRDLGGALLWIIGSALIFKTTFAVRALERHTLPMIEDLRRNDLDAARKKASMVVSRDTSSLDRKHLISCAAETVAENLVDSALSPMFYFGLAGVPAAVAYRVSNTEDAMVGYLDDNHRQVGWFSARLDDATNYPVARLSVPFILLALVLMRKDWRRAWHAAKRDWKQTSSPNKGWPMAAVAGGLGVKFEKIGHYSMGEGEVSNDPEVILDTVKVMRTTVLLFFVLVVLPLYVIIGVYVQVFLENLFLQLLSIA